MALLKITGNRRYNIQQDQRNQTPVFPTDLDPIIDELNNLIDGSITTASLTLTDTTDATSKDTGCLIVEGGIGVEKAIVTGTSITAGTALIAGTTVSSGTTITAGTSLSVGTNVSFVKEVNHTISVAASSTTNAAGGTLTLASGDGTGVGSGGDVTINSGAGGSTAIQSGKVTIASAVASSLVGATGQVSISSGQSINGVSGNTLISTGAPAGSGQSGYIQVKTGGATTGASGALYLQTGTATNGTTGDVTIETGGTTGIGNTGNVFIIAGNSTAGTDGTIQFKTGGTYNWVINSSGALNPATDNTFDIGNGVVNPRDISFSRGVNGYGAGLVGTPNTGVTGVHYGDGKNFTSVFTVSKSAAFALADAASLAVGYKIFDFPAGPMVINSSYMSMTITNAEHNTEACDIGLGWSLADGNVATLNLSPLATPGTSENVMTGQTGAIGSALVKTVGTQLVVESGDSHALYFNVAAAWADTAGAALDADIAGTITVNWTKMA